MLVIKELLQIPAIILLPEKGYCSEGSLFKASGSCRSEIVAECEDHGIDKTLSCTVFQLGHYTVAQRPAAI